MNDDRCIQPVPLFAGKTASCLVIISLYPDRETATKLANALLAYIHNSPGFGNPLSMDLERTGFVSTLAFFSSW